MRRTGIRALGACTEDIYNAIRLPKRATRGSAGYDFFAPTEIRLAPGESIKLPTGIRAEMEEDWVLKIVLRAADSVSSTACSWTTP